MKTLSRLAVAAGFCLMGVAVGAAVVDLHVFDVPPMYACVFFVSGILVALIGLLLSLLREHEPATTVPDAPAGPTPAEETETQREERVRGERLAYVKVREAEVVAAIRDAFALAKTRTNASFVLTIRDYFRVDPYAPCTTLEELPASRACPDLQVVDLRVPPCPYHGYAHPTSAGWEEYYRRRAAELARRRAPATPKVLDARDPAPASYVIGPRTPDVRKDLADNREEDLAFILRTAEEYADTPEQVRRIHDFALAHNLLPVVAREQFVGEVVEHMTRTLKAYPDAECVGQADKANELFHRLLRRLDDTVFREARDAGRTDKEAS